MPGPRGLAKHRGERESYERIGERCEEIAQELEGLIDGLDAASITEGGVGGPRCAIGGPSLELRHSEPVIGVIEGDRHMWSRWICTAAICLLLASQAQAGDRSGPVRRVSCTMVRFYVAKYTASATEAWARSHGATDAEIEAARQCLKDAPAQPTLAAAVR
jgi:hypothetical protein